MSENKMTADPSSTYDDEIDLREIVLTLWKGRWPILILTLAAALVAFAVSAWLLPKQYQAVAYVTVAQPAVRYLSGPVGLSAVPAAPDIKALPELLKTGAILQDVAVDPRVVSFSGSIEKLPADQMQVSMVGVSQLRFQVKDTDPQRAAALATVWAEKAAEWIEINYGLGALTTTLDAQIAEAQHAYAQTQSALETFLEQDQTIILESQMGVQKDIYICLGKRVSAANSLLLRVGDFETSLVQSDDPLSLSDAILLASIQQDSDFLETCGSSATILQPSSPTLFNNISSSLGLEVTAGLRQNLQQRIASSKDEQDAVQKNIMKLQVEIEQLSYQRTEFTRQRDQANILYQELTFQQALMEIVLQQSGRVAQVSAPAKTPRAASSPKPMMNTGVAGMLGLILGIGWTLGADWWKKVGTSA